MPNLKRNIKLIITTKRMKKKKTNTSGYFDILTSIWILASNDENPQITYEGIKYRLGLDEGVDLKALVLSRGELFRKQTQQKQLDAWKEEMNQGSTRIPSYIRDIADAEERKKKIDALTITDVFRSQFRPNANSVRSEIEIINWGLEHIDRLRKAELESNQEKTRIFTSILLPLLPTIIAVIAVVNSYNIQKMSNENQIFLKHYEVELKPKQEGYADIMKALSLSFYSAQQNNSTLMYQSLDKIESSYYIVEPFLCDYDRDRIWGQIQQFAGLCTSVAESDSLKKDPKKSIDSFFTYKKFFRKNLYKALFAKEKKTN